MSLSNGLPGSVVAALLALASGSCYWAGEQALDQDAGPDGGDELVIDCMTERVETFWGEAPDAETRLAIFDAFWHRQCLTTATEILRVREVCAEFGDRVLLREYDATDSAVRTQHEIGRQLMVNGQAIGWGYEAPRDGLRRAIPQGGSQPPRK